MAENEEELKSPLMKVKEESKKAGLKCNIQKTKIIISGPITSWQIVGEGMAGWSGGVTPAHHSSPHPQPRAACASHSLTTLSSGTEWLRVHSWLFTKESAGEKATRQGWDGTAPWLSGTGGLHDLAPLRGHSQKTPSVLVSCARSSRFSRVGRSVSPWMVAR